MDDSGTQMNEGYYLGNGAFSVSKVLVIRVSRIKSEELVEFIEVRGNLFAG